VNTGERLSSIWRVLRVRKLVDGLADLLDYGEAQARAVLRSLPMATILCRLLRRGQCWRRSATLNLVLRIQGRLRHTRLHRHRSADAVLAERADRRPSAHSLILVGVYYVLSALARRSAEFRHYAPFHLHIAARQRVESAFPAAVECAA